MSETAAYALGLHSNEKIKLTLDILANLIDQNIVSVDTVNSLINDQVQAQIVQLVNNSFNTTLDTNQLQSLTVSTVETKDGKTVITTNEGVFTIDTDDLNSNNPFDAFSRQLEEESKTDQQSFLDNLPSQPIANSTAELNQLILDSLRDIQLEYQIHQEVSSPQGKWPSVTGNVMAIDQKFFAQEIIDTVWTVWNDYIGASSAYQTNNTLVLLKIFLESNQSKTIQEESKNIRVNDLSLLQNMVMSERVLAYDLKEGLDKRLIAFTNSLYSSLGSSHRSSITALLALTYKGTIIVKYFLDNLVVGAILILVCLAMLLIYSLMI